MTPCSGVVSLEVAEGKAILTALEWIQAVKLPISAIASDCQSVIDKIYNSYCNNSVLSDVVNCIKNSLLFSPNLSVIYVPRDCNKIAHLHAKTGLGLDNKCTWNGSLPSNLT
ncbi:hypothetical protein CsatB_002294 [Cannabis sativa]